MPPELRHNTTRRFWQSKAFQDGNRPASANLLSVCKSAITVPSAWWIALSRTSWFAENLRFTIGVKFTCASQAEANAFSKDSQRFTKRN